MPSLAHDEMEHLDYFIIDVNARILSFLIREEIMQCFYFSLALLKSGLCCLVSMLNKSDLVLELLLIFINQLLILFHKASNEPHCEHYNLHHQEALMVFQTSSFF